MGSKHTPAPWVVEGNRDEDGLFVLDGAGDFGMICEISQTLGFTAVDEANAALIAAAPELLAALEAILNADDEVTTKKAAKMAMSAMKKATPSPA